MGADVQHALTAAREMWQRAERELYELDRLTQRLHEITDARRNRQDVARRYTNWLVDCRQVGVSVDRAGKAAGSPDEFSSWWRSVADHEAHRFFRQERNRALKEVADVIVSKAIVVDDGGRQMAFWAFPDGPHAGDPLVPRCQQYTNWLYESLYAPAAQLLFASTLDVR
jgi:hypothetical protein